MFRTVQRASAESALHSTVLEADERRPRPLVDVVLELPDGSELSPFGVDQSMAEPDEEPGVCSFGLGPLPARTSPRGPSTH